MIFIVYSATDEHAIEKKLGQPDYSYYFVLKEFIPVLESLGVVVRVTNPSSEVDAIYRNCLSHGEDCIFLSFTPPHDTVLGLECPTIPVFAWEFDSIPNESWLGEPRNDWTFALRQLGRGITHSSFAKNVVGRDAGYEVDTASIPAPVWDRFAELRLGRDISIPSASETDLIIRGRIIDSHGVDASIYSSPARRLRGIHAALPDSAMGENFYRIRLDGIIYTSVLNPQDGRKNWSDMLRAFCWGFRDVEDATLVLKLTNADCSMAMSAILEEFYKHTPMKCRVVVIDGYLSDVDYEKLALATTYVVNTAHGEGQCLPLMEYMALGKPAVAPRHTAMLDYVNERNSFVVESNLELTVWPQDERAALRTLRHRIDFESLLNAYTQSYTVAKEDHARYAAMSDNATESLRKFCSRAVIAERLRSFLMPISKAVPRDMSLESL